MHVIHKSLGTHKPDDRRTLVETGMIVFGILFAFSLESGREARRERRVTAEALRNIRAELEQNRLAVEAALPSQRALVAGLEASGESDTPKPKPEPQEREEGRGEVAGDLRLNSPILFRTAWDTATLTRTLGRTEYEVILAISRAYEVQKEMDAIRENLTRLVLDPTTQDPERRPRLMAVVRSVIGGYVALAEVYLKQCAAAVEAIGRK
jgi:hypothetical protein